jgi:PAS domain S-box-containing protein
MFNAVLSISPDVIILVDDSGRIVLTNVAVTTLFGYSPEELVGRPLEILIPTDRRERHAEYLRRFFETPQTRFMGADLDLAGRHQNGTQFFVDVGLASVTIRGRHFTLALVRDGHERQRGRQSASLLAAIVTSSEDAILSLDLEGIVTSWNSAAERMYGYEASEVLGRHISLFTPPDRLDELAEMLKQIPRGGEIRHYNTQRLRKDGARLDVSVTVSPIRDASGEITGASGIIRDITQRLAAERERRALTVRLNQSERLESLGRLAGGIAHDFNNLLMVILNYANFASDELDGNEAARADVAQIRVATERASQLTHQLLAFAGRKVLQPQVVNLNDVVTGVEQLLRRTIAEQVDLVTALSADLWHVEADPGQLEQVLVNLAVNARDAMPEGGVITIDTENVELDDGHAEFRPALMPGRYVRFRVSDTGCGMEKHVLDHVFEPFFTTKPRGEGTGLGLPMVFGIVTQAGGDIQLYSEPGVGTTCRVLLPATDRTPFVDPSGAEPRNLRGTETILVVEDEDTVREVARRILARNGYEVLTSANGPEAITLVEAHGGTIDLLLTDVILPQMLGKEIAARIQALRPDLPVLYMSGYAEPVFGSTFGDEIALLEKPFSEQLLLLKVRHVLDNAH